MMEQPCERSCAGRTATCHGECERYKEFLAQNEIRKARLFAQNEIDYYHYASVKKSRAKGNAIEKKRKRGLVR